MRAASTRLRGPLGSAQPPPPPDSSHCCSSARTGAKLRPRINLIIVLEANSDVLFKCVRVRRVGIVLSSRRPSALRVSASLPSVVALSSRFRVVSGRVPTGSTKARRRAAPGVQRLQPPSEGSIDLPLRPNQVRLRAPAPLPLPLPHQPIAAAAWCTGQHDSIELK